MLPPKKEPRVGPEPAVAEGAQLERTNELYRRLAASLRERAGGVARPQQPEVPTPEQVALHKTFREHQDLRRVMARSPYAKRYGIAETEAAKEALSNIEAAQFAAGHTREDPSLAPEARRLLPAAQKDMARTPFPVAMTYEEQLANQRGAQAGDENALQRLRRLASPENIPDDYVPPPELEPRVREKPLRGLGVPDPELTQPPETPRDMEQRRKPLVGRLPVATRG
jgi:hypothetical protein